jgi:hypothetical protein
MKLITAFKQYHFIVDTISKQLRAGNSCVIQSVPLYDIYYFEAVKGRELALYRVSHFIVDIISKPLRAGNLCYTRCPLYG